MSSSKTFANLVKLPLLAVLGALLPSLSQAENYDPNYYECPEYSGEGYYESEYGDAQPGCLSPSEKKAVTNSVTNAIRDVARPNLNQFIQPPRTSALPRWSQTSSAPRMLKSPGACTPKPNSLDCAGEGQNAGGANVSDRVRGGVIGEVGRGRAVTSGQGDATRQETCTPEPGKLTCAP